MIHIDTTRRGPFARLALAAVFALALAGCNDEGARSPVADAGAKATPAADAGQTPGVDPVTTAATAAEAPQPAGDVDMEKLLEPGPLKEIALGKDDAPVTIVEYQSMTCPHCARFARDTFPGIKQKYIDAGKVRYVFREFPFDPRAAAAFMLMRCAPESQYVPMMDVLFQQQETWATAEDARGALLQIAKLAGFTQESFEACLTNQKLLDDVNAVRNKGSDAFGVQATPTFFIAGKRYEGEMTVEQMSAIIDKAL